MYRIMLVDDEPLILAGITSLIPWEAHDCTIVGKASNGSHAYEQIVQLQPDIIITDIKMPVMNGLELISKCRKENLNFSFIVLTNPEEFELAKKALTLGASEYLVKINLTEESLLEALGKAKQNYDHITSSQTNRMVISLLEAGNEEITKAFFKKLLISSDTYSDAETTNAIKQVNHFAPHEIQLGNQFISPLLIMMNLSYLDAPYMKQGDTADILKIMNQASGIIHEMLTRFFKKSSIIEWEQQRFLLIISSEDILNPPEVIQSFCQKVNTMLKTYFEITAVFGISETAADTFQLPQYVHQTLAAINCYYYNNSSQIIFYREDYTKVDYKENFNINFLKKEISAAIQQNDSEKISGLFQQLIDLFTEFKPHKKQALNAFINLYTYIYSFFEHTENVDAPLLPNTITMIEYLNHLSCLNDIIDFLNYFRNKLCADLDARKNSRLDIIVALAQKYMKNHCMERLTLSSVSEALNISFGYLSSSFKKHTGSNLSEYISCIKIERAKELIDTHQYLMYEISDMLSYENPYYFSKVFKKVTGMSPREYEIHSMKQT